MNKLEEISREIYPFASLDEHGEEGTTSSTNEDDENGANSQVEIGVCASAGAAVSFVSDSEHFHCRREEGGRVGESEALGWGRIYKHGTRGHKVGGG